MMALENQITCFHCQASLELESEESISRREECHQCSSSVHCCKMCKFYDISSYNECREPQAGRIVDKEKANFCDFFKLVGRQSHRQDKEDLLAAARALFKDE